MSREPEKQVLLQRYNSHFRTFEKKLALNLLDCNMENVHELRLCMKEMRTLFMLTEIVSGRKPDKSPGHDDFDSLFRAAGKLREVQLNIKRSEKFGVKGAGDFMTYQLKREKRRREKLLLQLRKFPVADMRKRNARMLRLAEEISLHDIEGRSIEEIRIKLQFESKLLREKKAEKKLHFIRTQLNSVREIIELLTDLKRNSALLSLTEQLRPIHKKIGNWHDGVVLDRSLRKFLRKNPGMKDLEAIAGKLKKENRKKAMRITKRLRQDQDKLFSFFLQ